MQFNIINLFCLITLSFLIISCSTDNDNIENSPKRTSSIILLLRSAKEIGTLHNQAMEFVYDDLTAQNLSETDKDQMAIFLEHSLNSFYKLKFNASKYLDNFKSISNKKVESMFSKSETEFGQSLIATINQMDNNFSSKQLYYFRNLSKIIEDLKRNKLSETISALQILENEVISSKMDDNEIFPILASIEVTKSSANYWDINMYNWNNIISTDPQYQRTSGWFNWKETVKWDVARAAGGAVYAAATNIVVGPGTVAYGGAIVAGAAGTSATNAVKQLLDHWF